MENFKLPSINGLSPVNLEISSELNKMFGVVPSIFLVFASSENGLENYFSSLRKKNSLTEQENEVVSLVVSQINRCPYCLSFHTAMAKRLGFTNEQILDIRSTDILFDKKLQALASLTKNVVLNKGQLITDVLEEFLERGYDQGNLVDVVMAVGNITTMNLLYAVANIPIDWPAVTV
jgi:AhpD family alkylhydroperoxidase